LTTTKKERKKEKRKKLILDNNKERKKERKGKIMNAWFGRSLQAPGVFIVKSFIRGHEGGDETNEIKWSLGKS
jgi:hypothetical protein